LISGDYSMMIGSGLEQGYLSQAAVEEIAGEGINSLELDGKRVLVIIPDSTRTMPIPMVFDLFATLMQNRVVQLDYLVALGTHQPMNDAQLSMLVGKPVGNGLAGKSHIYNHAWQQPDTFTEIGEIPAVEIAEITHGLLNQQVPVALNKRIFDYDHIIICGPVFPHEVAGFSGGNKYFFPGIAGADIINFTHWLGALVTSFQVIGTIYTPVRVVIERAAEFITKPVSYFGMVVDHQGVAGAFFGPTKETWEEAARLSAARHIIYKDRPFHKVISIIPEMYADIWTAAKGMYKLEPVVADGGEVIIYAPHINEISYSHGKLIDEIGYHCRDYYLAQWDKFSTYPGGILAHSTHLRGLGEYDPLTGIEKPRIKVILATGIPPERCQRVNLEYQSPGSIHIDEWRNREDEGILVVERAGEMLYRLKKSPAEIQE
jgi:nickel-dependent lactate racemase